MPWEIFIKIRAAACWEAARDFSGLIAVSCMFQPLLFITFNNCGFMSVRLGWVSPGISVSRTITAPGFLCRSEYVLEISSQLCSPIWVLFPSGDSYKMMLVPFSPRGMSGAQI